jgi:hypothetical protein
MLAGIGQQRVAVRRRPRHDLAADGAAGARPVVDDRGLRPFFGEARRERARHGIGRAAGRCRHHDPHRLVGEIRGPKSDLDTMSLCLRAALSPVTGISRSAGCG